MDVIVKILLGGREHQLEILRSDSGDEHVPDELHPTENKKETERDIGKGVGAYFPAKPFDISLRRSIQNAKVSEKSGGPLEKCECKVSEPCRSDRWRALIVVSFAS